MSSNGGQPGAADRRRGGCLTTYLLAVMVLSLLGSLFLLASALGGQRFRGVPAWEVWGDILLGFASTYFAVALWQWKKLGAYGLMTAISIVTVLIIARHVLEIASGRPSPLQPWEIGVPLGFSFLGFVLRDKWHLLE